MDPAQIGVKYCGGCRELYDRKSEFEKTRAELSDSQIEFVPAKDGGKYDALLVICGCKARCADISKYQTSGETITIDNKEEMNCLSKNFIKAN